ncbi:class F sortase [Frankia sp. CiP3]|uniref:class F sortase n=1 Tax=Frankia sp. CiP3 TaxID=2880971 RepID=UPI001EF50073|nr:class F sortase [Frankia sp. CiP3]
MGRDIAGRKPKVLLSARWLILLGLILIGVSGQRLVSQEFGKDIGIPATTVPTGVVATDKPPAGTSAAVSAPARTADSRPLFLNIPALGTAAAVGPVGLNSDGTLQVPTSWGEIGWYEYGPRPGDVGAAVLVGHYDSTTGPAVFYRLEKIKQNDLVEIKRADGTVVRFVVDRIQEVSKSAFPAADVYGTVDRPELRLITCGGDFNRKTHHYLDNVIVFAHAV